MTRRFQFSFRGLLVVLTVGCIWLGRRVETARRQGEAVRAIKSVGGLVQYDWQGDVDNWDRIGAFRLVPADARPKYPEIFRRAFGEHLFQNVTSVVFGAGRSTYYGSGPQTSFGLYAPPMRYSAADDPGLEFGREIESVLPELKKLTALRALYLESRHPMLAPLTVSYDTEQKLRDALPNCQVIREDVYMAWPSENAN